MQLNITFRSGEERILASSFLVKYNIGDGEILERAKINDISELDEENIVAVHFADTGAQGDPGAVELLYNSVEGIQILYGNYAYGNLNIDMVFDKLPFLCCLDSRGTNDAPYPLGGKLVIPIGWNYIYMGAMNHFFCRDIVADKTRIFAGVIAKNKRSSLFDAIAWFCGADLTWDI